MSETVQKGEFGYKIILMKYDKKINVTLPV